MFEETVDPPVLATTLLSRARQKVVTESTVGVVRLADVPHRAIWITEGVDERRVAVPMHSGQVSGSLYLSPTVLCRGRSYLSSQAAFRVDSAGIA